MDKNKYCIVQESLYDKQHILGLILSIELYDKNSTCVVCCDEEIKNYIELFPKTIELNLDFEIKPVNNNFMALEYIKNIFNSLKYCVNNYKECVFVNKELIMTNPLIISDQIKSQGIGFIKKTINVIDKEKEFQRYSISLLYIKDIEYINLLINHYETELKCVDFFNLSFDAYDENKKKEETSLCIKIYAELPLFFINNLQITSFFYDYTYLGTEDFFAYENSVKLTDIEKNISIKNSKVSFCNIRVDTLDKKIQQVNNYFLNILVNKHIIFMSLLNLKMSGNKLQFIIPKRNGVGIWDRTNDKGGLYELIDFFTDKHKNYISKVEVDIDYFSFGNYLLTDKPSHIWLNNTIKKYTGLLICNHDKSLIELLPSLPIPSEFLFYYSYFPTILDAFIKSNVNSSNANSFEKKIEYIKVIKNDSTDNLNFTISYEMENNEATVETSSVNFMNLLEKLSKVKYGIMETLDIHLIATYMALGVVPIIMPTMDNNKDDNCAIRPIYDLTENVHYLTQKPTQLLDNYTQIQQNCLTYYNEHIQPDACLHKLLNFIFIRNIQ